MREIVSFNITNTTNGIVPISILGNNADAMDNSNASTQYQWDLSGFTITNETLIAIQYNTLGVSNFSIKTSSFSGTSLSDVINALNNFNLGSFFITTSGGSTFINNYNNQLAFGTLQIINPSQSASLTYSMNLNLPQDQFDVYKNSILINSFTNPNFSSGTIPVIAGDIIDIDVITSNNPKGTNVFIYNITTGVYILNTTQNNSGNLGKQFIIVANNSYLIGMSD
jgi:hypothetical protein